MSTKTSKAAFINFLKKLGEDKEVSFNTIHKGPDLVQYIWGKKTIHFKRDGGFWVRLGEINEQVVYTYRETATGAVLIAAPIDFEIPQPYDSVSISGFKLTVRDDLYPRAVFKYDEEAKTYRGSPMFTKEPEPRLVFSFIASDGETYSWRKGEYFERSDKTEVIK